MDLLKGMKEFARNPLGIIALFISMIYGFATLLLNSSAEKLSVPERWPIIIFIVAFPVLVLYTFYKLVTRHHGKLYAPGDYKDDKSFLRTLTPEEKEDKLEKELEESITQIQPKQTQEGSAVVSPPSTEVAGGAEQQKEMQKGRQREQQRRLREEIRAIEAGIISKLEKEFRATAQRDVAIGDTGAQFDALFVLQDGVIAVEVKAVREPMIGLLTLDRLLYNAVLANSFLANLKLVVAVVYFFDRSELPPMEAAWRRRIEKCPVSVTLKFYHRSELEK